MEISAWTAALLAVAVLALVIASVAIKGSGAISLDFLTGNTSNFGAGGIGNAIVGSAIIVGIATLMAVPFGILVAIYTSEFAGQRSGFAIRYVLDILNGVPTIVTGIFIFGLIVVPHSKQSGFAGSVALAIVMLPLIARSCHEVLTLVPGSVKEAGLALGASRWRTTLSITVPTALSGMITGALLAVARAVGETAPLLLVTSVFADLVQTDPSQALPNIPVHHLQVLGVSGAGEARPGLGGGAGPDLLRAVDQHRRQSAVGADAPPSWGSEVGETANAMERPVMNYEPRDVNVADPEETTMPRSPGQAEPATPAAESPQTGPVPAGVEEMHATRHVRLEDLHAYYGSNHAVKGVDLAFEPGRVTAIIGPSGCGKSTMVRCVNRMHEEIPGARSEGRVMLDDIDLHASKVDVVAVRRLVGMVFQKPNPFPTMSIHDNVAAGLRFTGTPRGEVTDRVNSALEGAGLWNEVKDRLSSPGMGLSGGQQQRLCIARALAVEPDVLLMDEPCSALDPVATLKIEELIAQLKDRVTIAVVTHNMQQAGRVADTTAFMLDGELVEVGPTDKMFTNPDDDRTEQYVTGKFG